MPSTLLAPPLAAATRTPSPVPALAARARRDLPSLTILRWWAAALVMALHLSNAGYLGGPVGASVRAVVRPGTVGVSMFFILSGFVLAWSAAPGQRASAFWLRRVARVYPLHLLTAVAALLLGALWVPALRPSGAPEALANLALMSAWRPQWWQALNPVSWTLTCEAFFYLLFPALAAGLSRLSDRRLRAWGLGAGFLVVALAVTDATMRTGWPLSTNPALRLPEFVVGVVAGMLVRRGAWYGPSTGVALVAAGVGYALAAQVPDGYRAACTVLGFGLLIPALACADLGPRGSLGSHPWLIWLGERSFALYLVHLLIIRSLDRLQLGDGRLGLTGGALVCAAVVASSVGLAALLHRTVELPAHRLIVGRARTRLNVGRGRRRLTVGAHA
ncbi:MAG: acyltransferase [Cellulomonas sp.]|nr:acyltransferase [Cellulomonas sp.]